MPSTTRISDSDHRRLRRLARETGRSQQDLIGQALDAYERERFFRQMDAGFEALRADPAAWAEELAEREAWDTTSRDSTANG